MQIETVMAACASTRAVAILSARSRELRAADAARPGRAVFVSNGVARWETRTSRSADVTALRHPGMFR